MTCFGKEKSSKIGDFLLFFSGLFTFPLDQKILGPEIAFISYSLIT